MNTHELWLLTSFVADVFVFQVTTVSVGILTVVKDKLSPVIGNLYTQCQKNHYIFKNFEFGNFEYLFETYLGLSLF